MTFVRFPLTLAKLNHYYKKASGGNSSNPYYQKSKSLSYQPYGEKVYQFLLKDYLNFYLPHGDGHGYKYIDKSEILLRYMMEYWLERHIYTTTKDAIGNFSQEGNNSLLESTSLEASYDLASLMPVFDKWIVQSTDTGVMRGGLTMAAVQNYEAPPRQVQRAIRLLVEHLVSDSNISKGCNSKQTSKSRVEEKEMRVGEWPLPTMQTICQTSIYNYIRTALRYGPVHVNNSSFYAALDLWLMWMEPWNVIHRKCFIFRLLTHIELRNKMGIHSNTCATFFAFVKKQVKRL